MFLPQPTYGIVSKLLWGKMYELQLFEAQTQAEAREESSAM
jgi:hypothetical protein